VPAGKSRIWLAIGVLCATTLAHADYKGVKLKAGVLADIAPTLCQVMGLQKPLEMNRLGLL
jgi:bisphosphoglycerate-independent phosphoglycerate mutase (AlkP superfamily)